MNEPDGNTAAERLHDNGMTTDEEREFEQTCLEIVRDEFYNDDQRALEIFDELSDAARAGIIRSAISISRAFVMMEFAFRSMAKYPWVAEKAWELIGERKKHERI